MNSRAVDRAGARVRLDEGLNPTELPARVSTSCETLDSVIWSEEYDHQWINSRGETTKLHSLETVYRGQWSTASPPHEDDRSRGTLAEPLPDLWWEMDRMRDDIRLKRIRRATREVRAASIPWLLSGSRLLLATATRAHYTRTPEGAESFRAGIKCLEAVLLSVGALGGATVYEAKSRILHPTNIQCCQDKSGICPLCSAPELKMKGTNRAPAAHLHAHLIVLVPPHWAINYGWLQRLELPRALDQSWGTLDISPGDTSRRGDSLGAYLGGYLSRLKDATGMQTAMLRRYLGSRARTMTRWGVLRGASRSGSRVWIEENRPDGIDLHVDRSILVRDRDPIFGVWPLAELSGATDQELQKLQEAHISARARPLAARARDAARVLGSLGLGLEGIPWTTHAKNDLRLYVDMEAWRRPQGQPTRPRPPRRVSAAQRQQGQR